MLAKLKTIPQWIQIAAAAILLMVVSTGYLAMRTDPCSPDNKGPFDGATLYECTVKAVADTHKSLVSPESRQAFLEEWQNKYAGTLQLKTEKGTLRAITEMLLSLKGRFDYVLPPENAEANALIQSGRIAGIGASMSLPKAPREKPALDLPEHMTPQLGKLLEDRLPGEPVLGDANPMTVESDPQSGTPAANAGMRKGDVIVAVDGAPVAGKTMSTVVDTIRGDPGTRVKLTLLRGGKQVNVNLVRAIIPLPTTEEKMIGDTAYLRIYHFESMTAVNQSHDSLDVLCGEESDQARCRARALVVDLRNNPGGLMDGVILISELFVREGNIVTVSHRIGDKMAHSNVSLDNDSVIVKEGADTRRTGRELTVHFPVDRPMVVLVNENSASGAEMLATVLQKQRGAIVVGKETRGKGVGQCTVNLPFGYSSNIICLEYLAGGHAVDWAGVIPDVVVDQPEGVTLGSPEDVQLDRALEIAAGGTFVKSELDGARRAQILKERQEEYDREVDETVKRFLQ